MINDPYWDKTKVIEDFDDLSVGESAVQIIEDRDLTNQCNLTLLKTVIFRLFYNDTSITLLPLPNKIVIINDEIYIPLLDLVAYISFIYGSNPDLLEKAIRDLNAETKSKPMFNFPAVRFAYYLESEQAKSRNEELLSKIHNEPKLTLEIIKRTAQIFTSIILNGNEDNSSQFFNLTQFIPKDIKPNDLYIYIYNLLTLVYINPENESVF